MQYHTQNYANMFKSLHKKPIYAFFFVLLLCISQYIKIINIFIQNYSSHYAFLLTDICNSLSFFYYHIIHVYMISFAACFRKQPLHPPVQSWPPLFVILPLPVLRENNAYAGCGSTYAPQTQTHTGKKICKHAILFFVVDFMNQSEAPSIIVFFVAWFFTLVSSLD